MSRPETSSSPQKNGSNGLNGWGQLIGLVGVPGAIALYLVLWLTQGLGAKLDRMIQLLEQIARALRVADG